jgi:hypothetical protein
LIRAAWLARQDPVSSRARAALFGIPVGSKKTISFEPPQTRLTDFAL